MRCEVLLFAHAAELLGADRVTIDVPDPATVGDAVEALFGAHAALAPLRGRVAIAVDERYAPMAAPLASGSTIALIPPVSGG
jgi:molybdopterin synthase sulfur carrier subunit